MCKCRHIKTTGETYCTHFGHAIGFGIQLAIASVAVFIHAIIPDMFTDTASAICRDIVRSVDKRTRTGARAAAATRRIATRMGTEPDLEAALSSETHARVGSQNSAFMRTKHD